jgi:hypothetical protein
MTSLSTFIFIKLNVRNFLTLLCSTSIFLLLASCGSSATKTGGETNNNAGISVDKLFLVDCLLPGQVRKLGSQMSFVTPRQPARLTATDCGVRGGEYTAYDRANLTSSINIWTPLAQQGDAKAQYYLGEIYETGILNIPDYQLAALWYQRAADQGYKDAQMNLGFLYESGKGVTQDKAKALNLYRLAADLKDDQLEYMSVIDERVKKQLEQWQGKLRQSEQKIITQNSIIKRLQDDFANASIRLNDLNKQQLQADISGSAIPAEISKELADLHKQQKNYLDKINQQSDEIIELRQEARQDRERMRYQMDGLNEQQLQLAKTIDDKQAELTRVTSLLAKVSDDYQLDKKQYSQDVQALSGDSQLKISNVQQQLGDRSMQINELNQKIEFYQQQENTYRDIVVHNKEQLAANQHQSEDFKRLTQAKIDSLLLELKQTQALVEKSELSLSHLTSENNQLLENYVALYAQSKQEKEKIAALNTLLDEKSQRVASKHAQIIRLQENVDQLNASLSGLKNLPLVAVDIAANNQFRSIASTTIPDNDSSVFNSAFGDFHALIIGNDNYEYLPNLRSATNDARSIEEVLSKQYGYKTTLLLNATRQDVLTQLYNLKQTLTDSSNLLVYYAGHGEMRDAKGHWLPVDAKPDNQANWISTQQVTDLISQFDARKIIIVADSCYSGVLTRSSILSSGTNIDINNEKHRRWLTAMSKGKSRTVLTSGSLQPVLDGGGGQHSLFAKHFIAALENNKTVVDANTLYNQIFPAVKEDALLMNAEQSPQYAPIKSVNHYSVDYFFINVSSKV